VLKKNGYKLVVEFYAVVKYTLHIQQQHL